MPANERSALIEQLPGTTAVKSRRVAVKATCLLPLGAGLALILGAASLPVFRAIAIVLSGLALDHLRMIFRGKWQLRWIPVFSRRHVNDPKKYSREAYLRQTARFKGGRPLSQPSPSRLRLDTLLVAGPSARLSLGTWLDSPRLSVHFPAACFVCATALSSTRSLRVFIA
jgi:hypothetical protein